MRSRVGVAGLGYWGPNLVRNLRALESCSVAALCDADPRRLSAVSRLYPDVATFDAAEAMIDDPGVDAVVLALPPHVLPSLGGRAMAAGKAVLLEKPMAPTLAQGAAMAEEASRTDGVAMVDYTFVYSPAVRKIKEILDGGLLGEPRYYQSTRMALGPFRTDVNVIWDHICHDVAIIEFLIGRPALSVQAAGQGYGTTVDTAHLTVTYDGGFRLFAHGSWMAPKRVRTGILACTNGMVVFDDVEVDEKVRVYPMERLFDPATEESIVPTYRLGDVHVPRLDAVEPLRNVAAHFVDAALGLASPITDLGFGLKVLAVLHAAGQSLESGAVTQVPDVGALPADA
jgi:predicted dehydrogenase